MNRLEQRCKGVQKVLEDYKIPYKKIYDDESFLSIINTPYRIEISNRYIGINYSKNHYTYFLPSFEGINEFRDFIKNNGTNFMILKEED